MYQSEWRWRVINFRVNSQKPKEDVLLTSPTGTIIIDLNEIIMYANQGGHKYSLIWLGSKGGHCICHATVYVSNKVLWWFPCDDRGTSLTLIMGRYAVSAEVLSFQSKNILLLGFSRLIKVVLLAMLAICLQRTIEKTITFPSREKRITVIIFLSQSGQNAKNKT